MEPKLLTVWQYASGDVAAYVSFADGTGLWLDDLSPLGDELIATFVKHGTLNPGADQSMVADVVQTDTYVYA